MALHLNLHHEIDREKLAKQRDPLKLSLIGIGVIAAMFAAYYFVQLGRLSSVKGELARKKAEYENVEPKARAAKQRQEELAAIFTTSASLVKRIENRFYWAPMLEQIARVVPREVQITKLSGDVAAEVPRKCTLTLDGLSAGTDPRRVAEEMRTAISEEFGRKYKNVSSTFRSLEDGVELVRVGSNQWPTATFTIVVQVSTNEEAPTATPAPRKKK